MSVKKAPGPIRYVQSTKYKTAWDDPRIETVQVDRENDLYVWVNSRRKPKRSSYENFFDTWEEAKVYLIKRVTRRLLTLKAVREQMEKILRLTPCTSTKS